MVSDKLKRIALHFPEKTQIDFLIRLRYDDFKGQTDFFREVIYAYLNNDPHILDFVESIKAKKSIQNKKRNKQNRKLINDGQQILKEFALDKEEIENIFDILEENNIDL